MALSMDRWIEMLAPELRLAIPAKKEVAHLLRHQRSKNDPGGGKPL
jgi:hypothetical protein